MSKYSKNFWLLCLSGLLFFASFSIMIPDLPAHLSEMGGEDHIGLIIFLFTVSALVSRPFSGKLADEWGRLPVMIFGALVSTLAALMYPFAATIWFFLAVRVFHGFCTGFKPTGTAAYVADIVPSDRRGAAMGIVGFASNFGTALAMAVGPLITQKFGINMMFATSGILGILSVLVLVGMKETLVDKKKFSIQRLAVKKDEFFEPKVLVPSVMLLMTVFTFGTVLTLGSNISDQLDLPSRGIYIFSYVVASLLVRITAGKLSDIYGRVAVLRVAVPVITIAAILMGTSATQTQFIVSSVFLGLGIGMSSPAIYAWTIDLSDDRFRGRGIATMYIFLEAGIGMGALLSGYLYSQNNNNTFIPFLLSAVLSSVAFFYLIFSNKRRLESKIS
ncbi:MAG: MFS transporter [Bacteroidota bacterium]